MRLKPNCLAGETKFAMTKILPAGAFGAGAEFAEGKGARGGEARVGACHGIAKDKGGEQISADRGEQATAQIGDENRAAGQFPALLGQRDRGIVIEMM